MAVVGRRNGVEPGDGDGLRAVVDVELHGIGAALGGLDPQQPRGGGVGHHARAPARLPQGRQKHLAVFVRPKHRLLAVPPAHHVVRRPRILHSWFSRHAPIPTTSTPVPSSGNIIS